MYSAPLVIMNCIVCSRLVIVSRGIIVGSVFATAELRVLLTGFVDVLNGKWPGIVRTKLYAVDLYISAVGPKQEAMIWCVAAIDKSTRYFEDVLGMAVPPAKKRVWIVVSQPRMARFTDRICNARRAQPANRGKLLGCIVVGGARRSVVLPVCQQSCIHHE